MAPTSQGAQRAGAGPRARDICRRNSLRRPDRAQPVVSITTMKRGKLVGVWELCAGGFGIGANKCRLASTRTSPFLWPYDDVSSHGSIFRKVTLPVRVSPVILVGQAPSNLPINEREREMIIRHARFITVLLLSSLTTGTQLRAEAEKEKLLYACDFERDCGIFQAEAKGNGFTVRLDTSSAHSGRQSVQLVDAGGADVDLVWMREWDKHLCGDASIIKINSVHRLTASRRRL